MKCFTKRLISIALCTMLLISTLTPTNTIVYAENGVGDEVKKQGDAVKLEEGEVDSAVQGSDPAGTTDQDSAGTKAPAPAGTTDQDPARTTDSDATVSDKEVMEENKTKISNRIGVENGESQMKIPTLLTADQTPSAVTNHSFEDGTLEGWKTTGDFNAKMLTQIRNGKDGTYSFCSYAGNSPAGEGDTQTGSMTSNIFTIVDDGKGKSEITFKIAGGNRERLAYVALMKKSKTDGVEDELLLQTTGRNSEDLVPVIWDTTSYIGQECYIKVVDTVTDGWGHIDVDDLNVPIAEPVVEELDWQEIDDAHSNIQYAPEGSWLTGWPSGCRNNTRHYNFKGNAPDPNATVTYTFTGTQIKMFNQKIPDAAVLDVTIYEGELPSGNVAQETTQVSQREDVPAGTPLNDQLTFTSKIFVYGTYTIHLSVNAADLAANADITKGFYVLDAFEVMSKEGDNPEPEPEPEPEPDLTESAVTNHSFEDGKLTGWTVIDGEFSDKMIGTNSGAKGADGNYFFCSYLDGNTDGKTGSMKSNTFTIADQGGGFSEINFKIAGGLNLDDRYVALVKKGATETEDEILLKATGDQANYEPFRDIVWDTSQWVGEECYIKVVDNATGGWGHIDLDDMNVPIEEAVVGDYGWQLLDDRHGSIVYEGLWSTERQDDCKNGTLNYTANTSKSDSVTLTFTGKQIKMYNDKRADSANINVKIYEGANVSGTPVKEGVANQRDGQLQGGQMTFDSGALSSGYGVYTIQLTASDDDASKTSYNLDAFEILTKAGVNQEPPVKPDPEGLLIDDRDEYIQYMGSWARDNGSDCYNNTRSHSRNNIVTFTFRGTGIILYNEKDAGATNVRVNLYEGVGTKGALIESAVADQRIDMEPYNPRGKKRTYMKEELEYGLYTIELQADKADILLNKLDGFFALDAFKVIGVQNENPYAEQFVVTYFDDDTVLSTQKIYETAPLNKPLDPKKEHYFVEGWYTDKELTIKYTFGTAVTKNKNLYIKWELDKVALKEVLDEANAIYSGATEGTTWGNYEVGSKAIFKKVIDLAQGVYDSDTTTIDILVEAIAELKEAIEIFTSSVVADPDRLKYYISPDGMNSAIGGEDTPIKTLAHAQARIRSARMQKASNKNITFTIYLQDGTHIMEETLVLTQRDSKITIVSVDGAEPVVSAGIKLTGWAKTNINGQAAYETTIPDGIVDSYPRQMYVDGARADRAKSSKYYDKHTNGFLYESGVLVGYIVNKDILGDDLRNPEGFEFVYNLGWRSHRVDVNDITDNGDGTCNVYIGAEEMQWNTTPDAGDNAPQAGARFYVENAFGYLNEKNEWYFDTAAKKIYYIPKDEIDMNTAEIIIPSGVESLIAMYGASNEDPIEDITIDDITFKHSTWLRPNEVGACVVQANFYINEAEQGSHTDGVNGEGGVQAKAAIELEYANNINITNNTLKDLGSTGIRLINSTNDVNIVSNTLDNISESSMVIGTWLHNFIDDSSEAVCKDTLIGNNMITNIGVEYFNSPGIAAYYTDSLYIENNTMKHLSYGGINIGWNGWQITEGDSTTARNTIVRNNHVEDYSKEIGDVGGIYSLGQQNNSEVYENFFKDANQYWASLYFDDGSGWITAFNNVTQNADRVGGREFRWLNCWTNRVHDIFVFDNYSNLTRQLNVGTRVIGNQDENHFIVGNNWTGMPKSIIDEAGVRANYTPLPQKIQLADDVAFNTNARFLYADGSRDFGPGKWQNQYAVDGFYSEEYNPYKKTSNFANGTYAQSSDNNRKGTLEVDVFAEYMVDSVEVTFNESNYAKDFDIAVSSDGINFTKVASVTGNTANKKLVSFEAEVARYVHIIPITLNTEIMQVINVSVFEDKTAVKPTISTPTKLALPQADRIIMNLNAQQDVVTNGTAFVEKFGNFKLPTPWSPDNADRTSGAPKKPEIRNYAAGNRPALHFDGWDDSLLLEGLALSNQNFTVSYYAKSFTDDGIFVRANKNGTLLTPDESLYVKNEWALWTFRSVGGMVTVFKDGAAQGEPYAVEDETITSIALSDNVDIRWTAYSGTAAATGAAEGVADPNPIYGMAYMYLAEFSIHDIALTEDEIKDHAQAVKNKYEVNESCTCELAITGLEDGTIVIPHDVDSVTKELSTIASLTGNCAEEGHAGQTATVSYELSENSAGATIEGEGNKTLKVASAGSVTVIATATANRKTASETATFTVSKAEQEKPDPEKPDPEKPDPEKPEPSKPDPEPSKPTPPTRPATTEKDKVDEITTKDIEKVIEQHINARDVLPEENRGIVDDLANIMFAKEEITLTSEVLAQLKESDKPLSFIFKEYAITILPSEIGEGKALNLNMVITAEAERIRVTPQAKGVFGSNIIVAVKVPEELKDDELTLYYENAEGIKVNYGTVKVDALGFIRFPMSHASSYFVTNQVVSDAITIEEYQAIVASQVRENPELVEILEADVERIAPKTGGTTDSAGDETIVDSEGEIDTKEVIDAKKVIAMLEVEEKSSSLEIWILLIFAGILFAGIFIFVKRKKVIK